MADEDAGFVRQAQDLLDAVEHRLGRTARKVAARRAEIGHEERVAHEGRIADHIGQAGGRVAGRVQHVAPHLPDVQAVALGEEAVELAAVALELGTLVEDLAEGVLNHRDLLADPDPAAQPLLDIGRGREVVGVDMRLEDPLQIEPLGLDEGDHGIGRARVGPPRGIIEVEDRIDDGAGAPSGSRTT